MKTILPPADGYNVEDARVEGAFYDYIEFSHAQLPSITLGKHPGEPWKLTTGTGRMAMMPDQASVFAAALINAVALQTALNEETTDE